MSGHSKFANIAHKKAANDAAKGKIFTRLGKEIMVAVKEGGPEVNNNSKLRQVVTKAKAANMPNDTIERAIKKAASTDMSSFESVTYEGYGPNGTAIIVEALTDNRNRAASNIRNAFTKGGGNVGTPGCVSFMFDNKGQIIIGKEDCDKDADELMMRFYHFYLITIFKNSQLFEGLNFFCRRRFHGSIGQKKVPPVGVNADVFIRHDTALFKGMTRIRNEGP